MQGHYHKRSSTWSYNGVNPQTGKRKQKRKGGFKQKKEAQLAAAEFQKELSDDTYVDESNIVFEDFAQEWLDLYQESVKIVEDIEQKNVVPKYLEKEELALFLKTAREKGIEDDYEFFLTLAYTGLRAGELCALKKTDQDTKLNAIIATKTYYNLRNSITTYELHQKQRHRYNY